MLVTLHCPKVAYYPSSIPYGPQLGPSWVKLGPSGAQLGNAAWVVRRDELLCVSFFRLGHIYGLPLEKKSALRKSLLTMEHGINGKNLC